MVLEISQDSPQRIRFHYIVNGTGNRFLFIPNKKDPHGEKDMYGWRGPIDVYPANMANRGVYRTLIPIPWWRQNEYVMYPLMSKSDFESLLPPFDEKNWPDQLIRMYFAKQVHAPESVLEELSRPGLRTRSIVAENPGAPREILERLALDTDNNWVAGNALKTLNREKSRGVFISEYLKSRQNFQNECQ